MKLFIILLLISQTQAFFTNDDIIKREIRDCFDTAFGLNARRVTETSSSDEMYRQLDACLRLNPLYVERELAQRDGNLSDKRRHIKSKLLAPWAL